MGVTGGLVRSFFPKNRLFGSHQHNGRSIIGEKKRWTSVRSYLCGDEFSSVLAEEDSGSVKESDANLTMSQPPDSVHALEDSDSDSDSGSALVTPLDSVLALEGSPSGRSLDLSSADIQTVQSKAADDEESKSETTENHIPKKYQTSISKLFEEDAAVIIQSAFRRFLATRRNKEVEEKVTKESYVRVESPSKESTGTSLEVQTGNSVKAFCFGEQNVSAKHRTPQKTRIQVLRTKQEDWDDSTVSSTISQMRIQNRLEAMTRRERALAYAFSQQLRICSKKKQRDCNELETNIGWSWLERWMATRMPDYISAEHSISNQPDIAKRNQRLAIKKRPFEVAGELESCGSNDVPVQLGSILEATQENEDLKPEKKNLKSTRIISKPKPVPSYDIQRSCNKLQANRKYLQRETGKAKKAKSTLSSCKRESKCKEASP